MKVEYNYGMLRTYPSVVYAILHMLAVLTHVKWFKRVFKMFFVLAKLTDHTKHAQEYIETADTMHSKYESILSTN